MYKISNEVVNFIDKTMKIWRVELTAEDKSSKGVYSKEMHYHYYYL